MGLTVAFAGNPNVGKSTLFNSLTGMKQHTGNWPGKTVETAVGTCRVGDTTLTLVDLPGTYSLLAHSGEEEIARDYILSGRADGVVVVCDATVLERNLNLALQVAEMTPNVLLCINLMDEAERKGITVDAGEISRRLSVPVITTDARSRESKELLRRSLLLPFSQDCVRIPYPQPLESAIAEISAQISAPNARYQARQMLCGMLEFPPELEEKIRFWQGKIQKDDMEDMTAVGISQTAERICAGTVTQADAGYSVFDRKIDRILTGKFTGCLSMLALLGLILWITMVGANYLSDFLAQGFAELEKYLRLLCRGMPLWLSGMLFDGVYRVLSWVIAVMLPPMAIFFPLFTLLEDAGVLPRIAFNLDLPFRKCDACGKQALCMCMGFGCNAVGVTGCRIIDSPRERLLAVLTNSFVPCNGRFPALLMLISLFFAGNSGILSAVYLTAVLLLGIAMTFAATKLLSRTLLRGMPSSFAMELPSYRMPRVGRVIVQSVKDRTLFVLGRATIAAAPAGLIVYLLGNFPSRECSYLLTISRFLNPLGKLLGMDGVILLSFVLGLPANEIVLPMILMAYTQAGSPVRAENAAAVLTVLQSNGWTVETALCTMVFFLMHWPCATTLLTVKKETGSLGWTALSALLPTAFGCLFCLGIHTLFAFLH